MKRHVLPLLFLGVLFAQPVSARTPAGPWLDVSFSESSAGSIPRGAQRVPLATLTMTSACEAPTPVLSVRLRHTGKGDVSDLERVYAMLDGRRVSDARAPAARDGRVTLRLRSLEVPACATVTLQVVADIAAEASSAGEHGLTVESPDELDAGGVEVHLSVGQPVAPPRVVPAVRGSVSVAFLDLLKPVRYGAGRTVSRFTLTAAGKDQTATAITLTNGGKATDGDLRNLVLVNAKGEAVTQAAATMDGDRVTLAFKPGFVLKKNATTKLELRADVRASRKRTIRFTLEEPSDLVAAPAGR